MIEKIVQRGDGSTTRLRSARLEVPSQPVRLPFGEGSGIEGSKKTLKGQVEDFVLFATSAPSVEFETARAAVATAKKKTTLSGPAKRRRLAREVEAAMVDDVAARELPGADPWSAVLHELEVPLRVVATRGVPALGTRTRWTDRLIDALFRLRSPEVVAELMLFWLYNRDHNSEDIEVDVGAVEDKMLDAIEHKKKSLVGVPERVWKIVEAEVLRALYSSPFMSGRLVVVPPLYKRPTLRDELLRAAFFTCMSFC